jgi:hypothetical protein
MTIKARRTRGHGARWPVASFKPETRVAIADICGGGGADRAWQPAVVILGC